MESKIAHLEKCAAAKKHNCWHCRFSFWFCLRFEVKCAFVVSRGLFVDVQRGFWKIDVWKEIVFLVNFGRWDLSCSSEGGSIHTLYTREWKEPIYCDIFGSRARLFKPLFEIESIEVLTDYMYGKSSLCLPTNNLNINGGFILWLNQKKIYIQRHRIRFSCHSTTLFRILLLGIPGSRMDSWNAKLRNLNKRSKRQIRADEKFSCHHQNFPWKHELTLKTFRKFKSSYSQVNSAQKTKLSFWGN